MNAYLTAALGVALFVVVILAAFLHIECRYSKQVHAACQEAQATAEQLQRQLAAATDALLTDLDSIEPKDFLR